MSELTSDKTIDVGLKRIKILSNQVVVPKIVQAMIHSTSSQNEIPPKILPNNNDSNLHKDLICNDNSNL